MIVASQLWFGPRSGPIASALTSGFHVAFLITAGFAAAGVLIALTTIRQTD